MIVYRYGVLVDSSELVSTGIREVQLWSDDTCSSLKKHTTVLNSRLIFRLYNLNTTYQKVSVFLSSCQFLNLTLGKLGDNTTQLLCFFSNNVFSQSVGQNLGQSQNFLFLKSSSDNLDSNMCTIKYFRIVCVSISVLKILSNT